jgi:type IV pilus assembly protein PilC
MNIQGRRRLMPVYQYHARDQHGKLITGAAAVEDIQVLKAGLKERGLWLTKAKKEFHFSDYFQFAPRIRPLELLMYAKQMGVMLGAGISLVAALDQILLNASPRFRPVVAKISEAIKNGSAYAEALAAFPGIFSPFFIGMIEVGEAGGMLGEMHRKLTAHLQQGFSMKKKLVFASLYPSFILTATVGGVVTILVYAFPKIAAVYSKHHVELPLITRIMIGLSQFLMRQWYLPVGVIGLVLFLLGVVRIQRKPRVKAGLDRLSLKIPFYNEFINQMMVAQFALNFSLLLNSGVSILKTLEIVKNLMSNSVVRTYFDELRRSVQEGLGMATYMRTNRFFPPLLVSMIQTGESSGELIQMTDEASRFYAEEVEDAMKKFVAVIEPVLIIVAAGSVFLVLLAFYLPMFQMIKVIKQ